LVNGGRNRSDVMYAIVERVLNSSTLSVRRKFLTLRYRIIGAKREDFTILRTPQLFSGGRNRYDFVPSWCEAPKTRSAFGSETANNNRKNGKAI
jgi:hypothetical protein